MIFKLDDIEEAYIFASMGSDFVSYAMLCRDTGKIYYVSEAADMDEAPEEGFDEDACIEIPDKRELNLGKYLVFEFVEQTVPEVYDRVRQIFRNRGAYARYKDLLDNMGLLQRWHDFENQRQKEALRDWCLRNDIELEDDGSARSKPDTGNETNRETRKSEMTARFIGSGDAFGSGGRLQPCILVDGQGTRFALDFGLTALIGLRREGIEPNSVDAVLLSHLHGDHCGGVPFLLMDAMLSSKRQGPLTVVGPKGTEAHLRSLQESLFPGSSIMQPRFPVTYVEIEPGQTLPVAWLSVSSIAARHTAQTHPMALRVEVAGKSVAYTGDGAFTDELAELVAGADLLIAECYFYSKPVNWHLNYPDIARLNAKKTVLTHMHTDMLAHADEVPETCAHDGLAVTF
jgi:ribonuclease BN (tRNA processing enzyme)